jgi:hypothetical protein
VTLPLSPFAYPDPVPAVDHGDNPPGLTDGDWLRAQLDTGRTVTDIANEVGRTPRAVRYTLRRHDIPTPRDRALAHVSRNAVRRLCETARRPR